MQFIINSVLLFYFVLNWTTLWAELYADGWDGSIAVKTCLVHNVSEAKASKTSLARSTRFITPLAILSNVRIAFPVDGSDFNPPGRIIVQSFQ